MQLRRKKISAMINVPRMTMKISAKAKLAMKLPSLENTSALT